MKFKSIIIILFLSIYCYSEQFQHIDINKYKKQYSYINDYKQQGRIIFLIRANHYYEFKINLKKGQYLFILKGEDGFKHSIIEPSGYEYEIIKSNFLDNEVIRFENIMEKGIYKIKIYSDVDNTIEMIYGIY